MVRTAVLLTTAILLAAPMRGSWQAPPRPHGEPQFRAGVQLIEVPVAVTNRSGRPVRDLQLTQFQVLEDGRPQTIAVFERIEVPVVRERRPTPPAATPVRVTIRELPPDTRLFVVVLDDLHTRPQRAPAVKKYVRRFLERYVGPSDLVAVVSTGGRGDLVQDFTSDRARLHRAINGFVGQKRTTGSGEEEAYGVRAAMDVVTQLAQPLSALKGRRIAMLLFSEGIDFNIYNVNAPGQTEVVHAMETAIAALMRANVVLYTIDPRGLTSAEGDLVERNSYGTTPPSVSVEMPREHQKLQLALQSLRHLSEPTGGFAAINSNDLDRAFLRIQQESSSYYLLGYYPAQPGHRGEFRRIEVRVEGAGLRVSARKGYVVE